jgi:hypothetical protein
MVGDHVQFRNRGATGSERSPVDLLGYELTPSPASGVPAFRVSYYWHVNDPTTARSARVWVLFTDADGNYRKKDDGSPEFHNIHPLAYGQLTRSWPTRRMLAETYSLYVPPGEWNDSLHVRVAVAVGGRFLTCGPHGAQWAELGRLPSIARWRQPARLLTMASLGH